MNIVYLAIIIIALIAGFGLLLYLQNRKFKELSKREDKDKSMDVMTRWMESTSKSLEETRQDMKKSLDNNSDVLQNRLSQSNRDINERLDNAAKVIGTVSKQGPETGWELTNQTTMAGNLREPGGHLQSIGTPPFPFPCHHPMRFPHFTFVLGFNRGTGHGIE